MCVESGSTTGATLARTPVPGTTTGTAKPGPATTSPAPEDAGECTEEMLEELYLLDDWLSTSGPPTGSEPGLIRDNGDGEGWLAPLEPEDVPDEEASQLTVSFPEPTDVDKVRVRGDFTKARVTLLRANGEQIVLEVYNDDAEGEGATIDVKALKELQDGNPRQLTGIRLRPLASDNGATASMDMDVWACLKALGEYDQQELLNNSS